MDPLQELIAKHHNQDLEKRPGMVYQIWEDGEITLQKSGNLLWRRSLHSIIPGKPGVNIPMPVKTEKHSYACVASSDIAEALRTLMGPKDPMDTLHEEFFAKDGKTLGDIL